MSLTWYIWNNKKPGMLSLLLGPNSKMFIGTSKSIYYFCDEPYPVFYPFFFFFLPLYYTKDQGSPLVFHLDRSTLHVCAGIHSLAKLLFPCNKNTESVFDIIYVLSFTKGWFCTCLLIVILLYIIIRTCSALKNSSKYGKYRVSKGAC